jgi:hypothetical protein
MLQTFNHNNRVMEAETISKKRGVSEKSDEGKLIEVRIRR